MNLYARLTHSTRPLLSYKGQAHGKYVYHTITFRRADVRAVGITCTQYFACNYDNHLTYVRFNGMLRTEDNIFQYYPTTAPPALSIIAGLSFRL